MRDGSNLLLWLIRAIVYMAVGFIISKFIDDLFWNFGLTLIVGSIINYFIMKQWKEYFG